MNDQDPRFPDSERPRLRRALADLEEAYIAGRRPDLAALAPEGPWRVPYLLTLIPYDMEYRLRRGERDGSAVESYLAAFPALAADPEVVARLVQEEHDARRRAGPVSAAAETIPPDTRSRFGYRDRFPDLWPRLFPYTDASRLPEPGERIGDWYRVERELGRGAMGVVFACRDERLNRDVALKVLDPEGDRFRDATFRERFLREAESLAKVKHPNVVPVHAAGVAGTGREVPYFVMEYIEGESLEAFLAREGRLAPVDVVCLGTGIAEGLAAIHAAGLVHRDVNPRNVLRKPDGTPILLDLGLVRSYDLPVLTETGAIMGTPHYMAPEQSDGAEVDHRADLFSLGCILYRAATGRLPFPGEKLNEVLRDLRSKHPPAPGELQPAVPAALSDLILRLLAKRPEDRPQTAGEVLALLRGDPAPTGEESKPPPPPLPPPPRRWWPWAVGAVVVVGAVVAAVLLLRGGKVDVPNYTGRVDALIYRDGVWVDPLHPKGLPLGLEDHFKATVSVDPPAYLYVFWVETDGVANPLYPWDPGVGWGSRPAAETQKGRLSLPDGRDFKLDPKKPLNGVNTLVAFANPTPLRATDDEIRKWFDGLPRIDRAKGDRRAVVWFDNYAPLGRGDPRAPVVTQSIDPYLRWQAELKKRVGGAAAFQTAVSFAQGDG